MTRHETLTARLRELEAQLPDLEWAAENDRRRPNSRGFGQRALLANNRERAAIERELGGLP